MAKNALVVDISRYQGEVDFKALAAGGTIGVILKATQGVSYTDTTFVANRAAAKLAGLCVSSYHYLISGNIEQQMDYFYKVARPGDGDRLCIDYEDKLLTLSDLETAITRLKKIAPNVEITTYGANGFLGAQLKGRKNDILATTSLWVASYTSADNPTMTDLKGTWPYWSLWQYSDKGSVVGIHGNCDVNRWNGSPEALPGWFHEDTVSPPKPPVSETPVVLVNIQAPEGVTVKVTVNGS